MICFYYTTNFFHDLHKAEVDYSTGFFYLLHKGQLHCSIDYFYVYHIVQVYCTIDLHRCFIISAVLVIASDVTIVDASCSSLHIVLYTIIAISYYCFHTVLYVIIVDASCSNLHNVQVIATTIYC